MVPVKEHERIFIDKLRYFLVLFINRTLDVVEFSVIILSLRHCHMRLARVVAYYINSVINLHRNAVFIKQVFLIA